MFDSKQDLTDRVADAIDLAIDFATLGEYGLEPAGLPTTRRCEGRQRAAGRRSVGTWASAIDRFATQG